jgi:bifunctional UDP-N-acetylglucosamine pyrophosphorylase/glucosamine-1-phosphate N-acetyltransferase
MEVKPISHKKIAQLIRKGAVVSNPATLDIGDEVNIDHISGKDVKIYPGCRIYGSGTVISAGSQLGAEAPVTVDNCQLGLKVELKGGYFCRSVFLDGVSMGMNAHVREGCILEEQASGAHSVGLKQTILFPFVTLGNLINFCDCLMAGGTSRQNHSEVGSSYIHFNYTPAADKTTPSLIGDVPRGVMLNQPPIFLGGQGGMVGPLRMGYGNVVAAGSILRKDYPGDNQLIRDTFHSDGVRDFKPAAYPSLRRVVENNILYLANLRALEVWYAGVRKPFFDAQEFGLLIYSGVMDQLGLARQERLARLDQMARKAASAPQSAPEAISERQALNEHMSDLDGLFTAVIDDPEIRLAEEAFFEAFMKFRGNDSMPYLETIQKLPADVSAKGVKWLTGVVDYFCQRVKTVMPAMNLFKTFNAMMDVNHG